MKNESYCKGLESTIEECLNCPYPKCKVEAVETRIKKYHLREKKQRDYIIRKSTRLLTKEGVNISYIRCVSGKQANTTRKLHLAQRYTLEEAKVIMPGITTTYARYKDKNRSTFEIVRRDEENERINSNK